MAKTATAHSGQHIALFILLRGAHQNSAYRTHTSADGMREQFEFKFKFGLSSALCACLLTCLPAWLPVLKLYNSYALVICYITLYTLVDKYIFTVSWLALVLTVLDNSSQFASRFVWLVVSRPFCLLLFLGHSLCCCFSAISRNANRFATTQSWSHQHHQTWCYVQPHSNSLKCQKGSHCQNHSYTHNNIAQLSARPADKLSALGSRQCTIRSGLRCEMWDLK